MRMLEKVGEFKRDFKRESRGQHRATLAKELEGVLRSLADDIPLVW